jgi:uncharacterized protein (TIGR03067 family)
MRRHAAVVFAVISVLAGASVSGAADQVKKDPKGTWKVSSLEVDGMTYGDQELKDATLTCDEAGMFSVRHKDKAIIEAIVTLDPKKKPNTIDATLTEGKDKGKTALGIYEIKGDSYRVCLARPGDKRPTEFSAKAGSGQSLIVCKENTLLALVGGSIAKAVEEVGVLDAVGIVAKGCFPKRIMHIFYGLTLFGPDLYNFSGVPEFVKRSLKQHSELKVPESLKLDPKLLEELARPPKGLAPQEKFQRKAQQRQRDKWPGQLDFIRWALFEAPWYSQLALGVLLVALLIGGVANAFCKEPEKQTAIKQQAAPSTQQSKGDSINN